MRAYYINDNQTKITYELDNFDALIAVAEGLLAAPIDLDHLYYEDELGQGVFNLHTFEKA